MRLRSVLAALAAVPMVAAAAAPASAEEVGVPGCYGVAVVICNPAVEYVLPVGLEPFTTTIPVCAGTCIDVPVTAYRVVGQPDPHVCVKYEDRAGNQTRTCVPLGIGPIDPPPGLGYVEICGEGYYGAYVYDENGNQIAGRCQRVNTGGLQKYCDTVNNVLAPIFADPPYLNCTFA